MSSTRRVFYYFISLITLGILAAGLRTLIALLLDLLLSPPAAIGERIFVQQQMSLGLAMLIIGGPLWLLFWRNIQRQVNNNLHEIGAAMRQYYLNFILVVTSLITLFAAQNVIKWILSGVPRSQDAGDSLALMIVSSLIWVYHWKLSLKEGQPSPISKTLKRWHIYIISGWSLVWLTVSLVQVIYSFSLFLPVWEQNFITGPFWNDSVRGDIASLILGGIWWYFYWFRIAVKDTNSTLRQVYIYLLTISGSSIAGLTALVIGIYQTLVWFMGAAEDTGKYFQYLGWVIPAILVAAAVWSYHTLRAREEAIQGEEQKQSARRIHLYIMSFIGLGSLVAGLILLIGILLDLIINNLSPPIAVHPGWWQIQLSVCLALLITSVPIWWYYWNQVILLNKRGGIKECKARSRRIYLYVIIGASIIGLTADLVNIIYQILSSALTGDFGINVLHNSRWSIQTLFIAAPLLIYHWHVVREDQRKGAESTVTRKFVQVVASTQDQPLISRLEEKLETPIRFLRYSGPSALPANLTDEEFNRLIVDIESSPTSQIMLIVHEGKIMVLPYQEK